MVKTCFTCSCWGMGHVSILFLYCHSLIAPDKVLFFHPKHTDIFSYFCKKTHVVGTH